ncbi:predicted protein [Plenodomus lingam JN3]|uniref:Predicted protein n=1 Tax=Leptosphaeria maculans (strain JN3 / isolate v23.1.3 / race Av1-4-5-6-7-8) TaxID=985895 RepID=E4ZY58_LEPMJ|nr:predicted protein [Plenodomus lingam JN3]CBX96303.1 predicted protein [Plenodomus lingam JN3]
MIQTLAYPTSDGILPLSLIPTHNTTLSYAIPHRTTRELGR